MKIDFKTFNKSCFRRFALLVLVALAAAAVARAQTGKNAMKEPQRQQLLNNLRLLIWAEPDAAQSIVKLRINSGAAFDPQNKAGAMSILAEALLPDDAVKTFFAEELGGRIGVETNYDYIEITATGKNENLLDILEVVRNAVVNQQISAESFKKARETRSKIAQQQIGANDGKADDAVRKRLFGEFFPYGRPAEGTPESIARIERADLLQLRDRFLTADNATLAIAGNIDPKLAYRAVRQFFGAWQKSDKLIPPTFRQPDAVDKTVLLVKQPSAEVAEVRFAARGAARDNAFAAAIAAELLAARWRAELPEEMRQTGFVRHEAYLLPGVLIVGANITGGFAEPVLPALQIALQKIFAAPVAAAEFETAKTAFLAKADSNLNEREAAIENRLDADTYKISATNDRQATLKNVQDLINNWQKQTFAAVAVTQSEAAPRGN